MANRPRNSQALLIWRLARPWTRSLGVTAAALGVLLWAAWWSWPLAALFLLAFIPVAGLVWGRTRKLTGWGAAAGAAASMLTAHLIFLLFYSAPHPMWDAICADPAMFCESYFTPSILLYGWLITAPIAALIATTTRGTSIQIWKLQDWIRGRLKASGSQTVQRALTALEQRAPAEAEEEPPAKARSGQRQTDRAQASRAQSGRAQAGSVSAT